MLKLHTVGVLVVHCRCQLYTGGERGEMQHICKYFAFIHQKYVNTLIICTFHVCFKCQKALSNLDFFGTEMCPYTEKPSYKQCFGNNFKQIENCNKSFEIWLDSEYTF